MIDEKRIKEAENNVKDYLNSFLIVKYNSYRSEVFNTYIKNYKESIDLANYLFEKNKSNLWIIVISYYSMYYISNAVLYKLGYKTSGKISHKVTADSIIVFVRNKLKKSLLEEYEESKKEALDIIDNKADDIIESFDMEMNKRSVFQYEYTEDIKKSKAQTSLERAKRFIFEMSKLL